VSGVPGLKVIYDSELMVVYFEGVSVRAVDFLDAWLHPDLVVIDSGRFILPLSEKDTVLTAAREHGLTYEVKGS
jgi:hypothetical protein